MPTSHNKASDTQRKVEYFKNLKIQAFQPKKPTFNQPRFINVARRPGMRGK